MAAVRALVFAKVVGVYLVILEGDSKIIINALIDEADSFASYSHLMLKYLHKPLLLSVSLILEDKVIM